MTKLNSHNYPWYIQKAPYNATCDLIAPHLTKSTPKSESDLSVVLFCLLIMFFPTTKNTQIRVCIQATIDNFTFLGLEWSFLCIIAPSGRLCARYLENYAHSVESFLSWTEISAPLTLSN